MSIDNYRRVLAVPHVRPLLLLAVLCRLPAAAAPVVLTLHVVLTLDLGYGAAGLVGALATLGIALGAPWRGRMVDGIGLRRALVPSLVVETAAWGIGPFLPYRALLVSVLIGGLFSVPVFSVVRQSLASLVPDDRRQAAFALDSVGTELTFMTGPALAIVVATQLSSTVAMLGVGVATLIAAAALFALNPQVKAPEAAEAAASGRGRRALLTPRVLVMLGAASSATLVLAGTDVAIVAFTRDHGAVSFAAVIGIVWAAGSLVGGLVYGALARPIPPLRLVLALGLLTVPVGLVASPAWMVLSILPAALLCAPVLTATTDAVTRLVPEHVRGEAMGWYSSACTFGLAVGAPLAGAVMDRVGPWSGFAVVGVVGVLLGLVGLVVQARTRERLPVVVARETVGAGRAGNS